MKFGIVPINLREFTNPEVLIPFVQRAEALGYESVWTAEHVIIPKTYTSVYPYNPSGKVPFAADAAIIDPLVALTFIAAATSRLRLGTGVNILPQMNPLYLAKWASSIDHLSRGRLMLGVGIGWLREEFAAIGVPFAHRGKRADEYLQALKAVWSGEEVNFQGEFVRWQGFLMRPRPVQPGGVPLVIGGVSPAAIRGRCDMAMAGTSSVRISTSTAPICASLPTNVLARAGTCGNSKSPRTGTTLVRE